MVIDDEDSRCHGISIERRFGARAIDNGSIGRKVPELHINTK
jgi:hypothetical protein